MFRSSKLILASLAALLSVTAAWLPGDVITPSITGRRSIATPGRRWVQNGKIRGVNLGSLFVVEPWLCESEWSTMGCGGLQSEWDCVKKLGQDQADKAFASHWGRWITEDDFDDMKSYGLNAVRIPLGFWMDESLVKQGEYYPKGGEEHLLKVCDMASSKGFYIILDMHAAPGVQASSQSFAGHTTSDVQFFNDDNYKRGVDFLKYLTKLVHTRNEMRNVGMIGVVNEPAQGHDDLRSKFYPNAYNGIRQVESDLKVKDKLHVQFMGTLWGAGNPKEHLPSGAESLAFEDHRYQKWDSSIALTHDAFIADACTSNRNPDNESPMLVTEWAISPPDSVENSDPAWRRDGNDDFYKKWFRAQVTGYEKSTSGWTYWNWKAQLGDWRWSYRDAVGAGIIPKDLSGVATSGACS
ncbi:endo-beta-1,6-glucanase [Hypoxylon rubiginosum]|uniref:Endo-beta-1,6-glucanase n=1 Tax=Hypoxylon rubiginosum TaxID=110542 RepID=A0ACC0DHV3_9PEZI|nr:endo-beta-1,6-glucanase [Hypoxylon rubiginosum]